MSTPDKSIDPRLLESAKAEFMKHGFLNASLKTICENARITTGAVYKRYKGKEELFCAVVQDTVDALDNFITQRTNLDFSSSTDEQVYMSWMMNEEFMLDMFRMLWNLSDGFTLLISRAAGTRYENFQHSFVERMSYAYEQFYKEAYNRGLAREKISQRELHVLCSSFWTSVYEPFIHGMTWEEIEHHCKLLCRFFDWKNTILLDSKEEKNV